jgi:hypothetical protein
MKKKRKPAIAGKTKTAPRKPRSASHLHPQSKTHRDDHEKITQRRQLVSQVKKEHELAEKIGANPRIIEPKKGVIELLEKLQRPATRRYLETNPHATAKEHGFVYDLRLRREVSVEEFVPSSMQLSEERRHYRAIRSDRGAEISVKTAKPLHAMTVTTRPDFDRALDLMQADGHDVLPILRDFAGKRLPAEFQARTDYDLAYVAGHLGEGNRHFHPIFASVSEDGELLHHGTGVGKKGPGLIGPALIGVLRLGRAGFLSPDDTKYAEKRLAEATEKLGGAEPLDWALAQVWDLRLAEVARDPKFEGYFAQAEREYRKGIAARTAEDPLLQVQALKEENQELLSSISRASVTAVKIVLELSGAKEEILRLREEIAGLRPAPVSLEVPPEPEKIAPVEEVSLDVPPPRPLGSATRFLDSKERGFGE